MSTPITVTKSITITDAILTTTDVAESAYAAYSAGTTYAADTRVHLASVHKVYQSLQAANTGNSPDTSPLWWVEVEPTNRWKMFDLSSTTQTEIGATGYYELTPARAVNTVALLNIVGLSSVRVRMTDPVFRVVYDRTSDTRSLIQESTWYSWFFESRTEVTELVLSDLPSYPNAVIRLDIASAGSSSLIGALIIGTQSSFGLGVQYGARLGIQDYSRKERNDWGDTVLVQRAYAKRITVTTPVENTELDRVYGLLSDLRATPCLWKLSDKFNSTTVFGFYASFDITISYATFSDCSLELESLT